MGLWLRVLEIGLVCSALLGLSLILFPSPMQMAWNGLFFGQWAPPASFSFSLWSGFWPNALLNLGFGVALLLPLWKLRAFTD